MSPKKEDQLGLDEDWGNDGEEDKKEEASSNDDSKAGSGDSASESSFDGLAAAAKRAAAAEDEEADDDGGDDDDDEEAGGDEDEDQDEGGSGKGGAFALHNACERGDVETISRLIAAHNDKPEYAERLRRIEGSDEAASDPARRDMMLDLVTREHRERMFGSRDNEGCTPLHVAVLSRQLEAVKALLSAGARVTPRCNNMPVTHLILSVGSLRAHQDFAADTLRVVLRHRVVATDEEPVQLGARDDLYRSVLHLAAEFDFPRAIQVLKELEPEQLSQLWPQLDMEARTALHVASRVGSEAVLREALADPAGRAALDRADSEQLTALHVCALHGFVAGARLLLEAAPGLAERRCSRGLTPLDWARRHGCARAAALLSAGPPVSGGKASSSKGGSKSANPAGMPTGEPDEAKRTLIISHEVCSKHYTCLPALTSRRGMQDVPPENVNRLKVLLDEDLGVLRTSRLEARVDWSEATRANIADVLRVHEYAYIKKLQRFVRDLGENQVGELDGDTSISGLSFEAALFAAGSVMDGVDAVCAPGANHRNVFCAVRPPGHHAGPRGVVTCKNDPNGSYGFCLLSNAAIGAAYARHVYRHQGVKRVAIVDFDVHHGNGTEACVKNLLPSVQRAQLDAPFCEVQLATPVYKPWLNEEDGDNVFFASIHGFGKRVPGLDPDPHAAPRIGMFYPSDGANFGFAEHGKAKPGHPKVVDVGQNSKSRMEWRSSWRKHVLPALAAFEPHIVFISAGFDAHKQDDINMGYISALEQDYYWLTRQLVKIANKTAQGRVVSVLEGGYKIQGRVVSPFARSVCAHVAALAESTPGEQYDLQDAVWEENHEQALQARAKEAQAERIRQAEQAQRASEQKEQEEQAAAAAAQDPQAHSQQKAAADEAALAAGIIFGDELAEPPRKRSRRAAGNIDYKQLNDQLNDELKAAKQQQHASKAKAEPSSPAKEKMHDEN
jgi:acetoin utilization deacetylase AcuC-like enzyme/ankyrin repeat protein